MITYDVPAIVAAGILVVPVVVMDEREPGTSRHQKKSETGPQIDWAR